MNKLYCLFLMLLSTGTAISQCLIQKIPLTERMQNAELVVEGKVTDRYSFDEKTTGKIYTANEIEVTRVFKGTPESSTITIFTPGGVLGDRMDIISPSLQLSIGEAGVFMLQEASPVAYAYAQRELSTTEISGHFGVTGPSSYIKYDLLSRKAIDIIDQFNSVDVLRSDLEEITGQKASVRGSVKFYQSSNNKKRPITSISPTTISGGTGSILTISGSGFGSTQGSVGFADANDGGSSTYIISDDEYFVSWSNTEIKVYVPTRAGSGKVSVITSGSTTFTSTSDLTVEYTRLELIANGPAANPGSRLYRPSLDDDNGNGGLTWIMHKDFKNNVGASKTLMRALQNWRCSTGVNFNIDTVNTTTVNTFDRDDVHAIFWENANQSASGALAVTSSQWSGCFSSSANDWHWFLNDVDMVFDEVLSGGRTWNYGPDAPTNQEYDMESVALHEFGHAHQLSHIINTDGTMHYSIRNGAVKRTLDTDTDIKGGNDVMSTSTVSTGCSAVDPMIKLTSNCKLIDVVDVSADYDASSLKICAGGTITFTNKSTPTDNSIVWRLPPSAQVTEGSINSQQLEVLFPVGGSFVIGVVAENKGFVDSLYKNVNINATPTVAGRKITDVSCNGANDGEISLLFGAGKAPFTVTLLSDNSTGNPIENLAPGKHIFSIKDDNGCTNIDSNDITEPAILEAVSTGKTDTWSGVDRGKAWVEAAGGTAPYSYSWNDANSQSQDTARNLAAGSYTVTITDDNDCETTADVEINELVGVPEYAKPTLYPNPAENVVFIQNAAQNFSIVEVLDMSGRVLETELLSNNHQLDVTAFSKGTYLLRFTGNAGTHQELLVKE